MIHRIDVTTRAPGGAPARGGPPSADPLGEAVRRQMAEALPLGPGGEAGDVGPVEASRVYLIDADADPIDVARVAAALLADPVVERAAVHGEAASGANEGSGAAVIEVHLKPGVMDPVAASVGRAARDAGLDVREVRTGRAYRFARPVDRDTLDLLARRVLANGVVESVHLGPFVPAEFPAPPSTPFAVRHVDLTALDDDGLRRLSRDGHLFLSLDEMRAVQSHFQEIGREPTDCELETVAQTWSEHCVHKTLKSAVEVRDESGAVVRRYGNLIKETIFAATVEIMGRGGSGQVAGGRAEEINSSLPPATSPLPPSPFCLSVFVDNAGVVAFDDTHAVCFKAETHNRPSAIDPYGGSATGVGGVIRDVLGTGLGARPIANTDVFCVAYPEGGRGQGAGGSANRESSSLPPANFHLPPFPPLPPGVLHPKRILRQVVAGVRDYGNRMGIPTVNGAVVFHDDYVGNPLVFCGCVGVIPRDKIDKAARPGDAVVVMGGRTGRDGIHGATFSSAELTDTRADEFSHAVQIGNAITEKQVADVLLAARDAGPGGSALFSAVTDCGAGGLSSAVGEMGEKVGAVVDLEKVPLKYAGLRYDEVWISEAQERMVLSVPPEHVEALLALAAGEDVEATVIGTFGQTADDGGGRAAAAVRRRAGRPTADGVPARRAADADACGDGGDRTADDDRPCGNSTPPPPGEGPPP